jgi:hypothetical protein
MARRCLSNQLKVSHAFYDVLRWHDLAFPNSKELLAK